MMRSLSDCGSSATYGSEEAMVIKKGPWTEEEDSVLSNYVNVHGEGHWNSLARCAGLKRTGKSCRLRWLNYLRPNVRRGNITLHEQLLILDLHSRWGNRWSKIAEQLPGRTDNEIKNYWRTRVVKQAKQLKCDVNSKQFRDTMRFVWMPRLMEQIQASCSAATSQGHGQTEPCVANPSMLSSVASTYSTRVDMVHASSLSDSNVSYNLMGGGGSWSEKGSTSTPCMLQQAVEPGNGFGGADLWTDENIWFLQQLLADD